MEALSGLRRDHRSIRRLLARLAATTPRAPQRRATLLTRLDRVMAVHAAVEEEVLYPTLEAAAGSAASMHAAYEAHLEGERLFEAIDQVPCDDLAWPTRLIALRQRLEDHLAEEEASILPLVRTRLDARGRRLLDARLSRRRAEARAVAWRARRRLAVATSPEDDAVNADVDARGEAVWPRAVR